MQTTAQGTKGEPAKLHRTTKRRISSSARRGAGNRHRQNNREGRDSEMPPYPSMHRENATSNTFSPSGGILQRKGTCIESASPVGECADCQRKTQLDQPLEGELPISQPGDRYEQEADRITNKVMQMSGPKDVPDPASPTLQKEFTRRAEGDDHSINIKLKKGRRTSLAQVSAISGNHPYRSEVPKMVHEFLVSPGYALDSTTRGFMEPRLKYDLSRVRIHADQKSATVAQAIQARAFTIGNHIGFATGAYQPETQIGRRLISHELVHFIQASTNQLRPFAIQRQSLHVTSSDPSPMPSIGPVAQPNVLPDPGLGVITFNGQQLSTSAIFVRRAVERIYATEGYTAVTNFERDFVADISNRRRQLESNSRTIQDLSLRGRQSDVSGTPLPSNIAQQQARDLLLRESILPVLHDQINCVRASHTIFLGRFRERAVAVAEELLRESMQRVSSERSHYGLVASPSVVGGSMNANARPGPAPGRHDSPPPMANNEETRGLQQAARELAQAQRRVIHIRSAMRSAGRQLDTDIARLNNTVYLASPQAEAERARIDASRYSALFRYELLQRSLSVADQEYNILLSQREALYPILGAYASEARLDELDTISSGDPGRVAPVLRNEISNRTRDITDMLGRLRDGSLPIWRFDRIISITKLRMHVSNGSIEDRWIQQRVSEEETRRQSIDDWLGLMAFVFGVIGSIPTGGASLAVAGATAVATGFSVAATGILTFREIQEYQLQAAASGTDFSRAQAISSEEPSLLQLAIDIITSVDGMRADLHAARGAFRRIVELRRTALRASGLERAAALERLRSAGEAIHPGAGTRMVNELPNDRANPSTSAGHTPLEHAMHGPGVPGGSGPSTGSGGGGATNAGQLTPPRPDWHRALEDASTTHAAAEIVRRVGSSTAEQMVSRLSAPVVARLVREIGSDSLALLWHNLGDALANLRQGLTGQEILALMREVGSSRLRWAGGDLPGSGARLLLSRLSRGVIDHWRDVGGTQGVSARGLFNLLQEFGEENLSRWVPVISAPMIPRVRDMIRILGHDLARLSIDVFSYRGRVALSQFVDNINMIAPIIGHDRLQDLVRHVGADAAHGMIATMRERGNVNILRDFVDRLRQEAGREGAIARATPLGPNSIILDSNIELARTLRAQYNEDPRSIPPEMYHQGHRARLNWLGIPLDPRIGGDDYRIANQVIAESERHRFVWRAGIQLSVARESPEYQTILGVLTRNNIGRAGNQGAVDRAIITDAFFAAVQPGVTPRYATGDADVILGLAQLAGIPIAPWDQRALPTSGSFRDPVTRIPVRRVVSRLGTTVDPGTERRVASIMRRFPPPNGFSLTLQTPSGRRTIQVIAAPVGPNDIPPMVLEVRGRQ